MLVDKPTISSVMDAIRALHPREDDTILILFAEKGVPDIQTLIEELNQKGISFFGGIFPGIIHGNKSYESGCLLKKFKMVIPPQMVQNISKGKVPQLDIPRNDEDHFPYTAITFVDGLAKSLSGFLESLNNLIGDRVMFIGGGAGSLELVSKPCVFSSAGFHADASVICVVENRVSLDVRHGWEKLAGPFIATRTEGNQILTLNWEKSYDVYRPEVEADSNRSFADEDFFSISQGYPFGMLRENAEDIVRDPIGVGETGELICVGEVPDHTVLYLLKGDKEGLINAAKTAAKECTALIGNPNQEYQALIIDCISRKLYLKNEFGEELEVLDEELGPIARPEGVLSLGELSSYSSGLLEFFNKTVVVGLLATPQITN